MNKRQSWKSLTSEYKRLCSNVLEFAKECYILVQESPDTAVRRRFGDIAWQWQYDLLVEMEQNDRLVILKARQLGVTWLVCIYTLWTIFTKPSSVILVFSQTQDEAKKVIERIEFIYENLPAELRILNPITSPHSRHEIGFLNNSRVIAMPSTERAGRSYTATMVILDEHAFYDYAEKQFAAAIAAAEHGKVFSISTANGVNNFFYTLYTEAKAGKNGFKAIFLPYNMHPERDEEWYLKKSQEMVSQLFHQEYPRVDEEAFITTAQTFIAGEIIAKHKPQEPLNPLGYQSIFRRTPPHLHSFVKVWELPLLGATYSIGVDPTTAATSRTDNAAIVVINAVTGEQAAEFAYPCPIEDLVALILDLWDFYKGIVVCERNGVGAEVNKQLVGWKVDVWQQANLMTLGWTKTTRVMDAPGLHVTGGLKKLLYERFATAMEKMQVIIKSSDLLAELFHVEVGANGMPKTPVGKRDDRVSAAVMAWAGVLYLRHIGRATEVRFPSVGLTLSSYIEQTTPTIHISFATPARRPI